MTTTQPTPERIALVTGANRGIGFEVAKQLAHKGYFVYVTARDLPKAEAAAQILRKELGSKHIEALALDVTSLKDINTCYFKIASQKGRLDVLVNNAGVFLDPGWQGTPGDSSALLADPETIRKTFEINTLAPLCLIQKFVPLMKKQGYGRIVNVSSGMGQLAEMEGGFPGYRISKTALNAVTKMIAAEVKETNVLINSLCPGWVRTDMGGKDAHRSVAEGADTIVWLATLDNGGPSGGFFRDRTAIPW